MKSGPNLYARLGVPADADMDEVRHAYREAARRLHPDTNTAPGETELFLQIQQAYEVISDPEKRAKYDKTLPKEASEAPPVQMDIKLSRSSIPKLAEPQLFYALINLFTPEDDTSQIPPINACLVIDCSTSMQGQLMDSVKSASVDIIRSLHPQDLFGLVAFNDNAQVLSPGGMKLDLERLETAIHMLKPQGATEIFKGLQAGYEEIKKTRRIGYINHMVLLTDGKTYGDEERCLRLARQARDEGIALSTLGIGNKWNDDFLDELASTTGGSCSYISNPEDIAKFMKERFYNIGKSFASQVALHTLFHPSVDLNYAFRLAPDASPLEIRSPIQIGPIPKGNQLSFILEFNIRPLDEDIHKLQIAKAHLAMEIPSRVIPFYNMRFPISVPVGPEKSNASPPSVEIVQALSKLTLYRMQERVQKDIHSGDMQGAAASLRFLATNLLARGEKELASTVIQEVSTLEENNSLSDEGKKKIKYGTRSLVLDNMSLVLERNKKIARERGEAD